METITETTSESIDSTPSTASTPSTIVENEVSVVVAGTGASTDHGVIEPRLNQHQYEALDRMKVLDRKMRVSNLPKAEFFSNVGIYVEPKPDGIQVAHHCHDDHNQIARIIVILAMIYDLKGAKLRPARTVVQTVASCTSPQGSQTYSVWSRRPLSEPATSAATLIIVPDNEFQHWIDHIMFTGLKHFIVNVVSRKVSNVHDSLSPRSGGFSEFDVVLCKASQYHMFASIVDEVWSRLVIDEIDSIRFTGGKIPYTAARFVWLTTSSKSYKAIKTGAVPRGFIKELVDQRLFWKNMKPFIVEGNCRNLLPIQTPSPVDTGV